MQKNALSYKEIINYFGENKVADRYKYLYDKMQEYIRVRALEESLYICEPFLQQAVMDYFTDIYRLKAFHRMERADMEKILAYEIHWILRRKPLQMLPDADDCNLVFANEGFCTTLMAHAFLVKEGTSELSEEMEESLLELMKAAYYHFKYRNIDKQDIELMLFAYRVGKKIGE